MRSSTLIMIGLAMLFGTLAVLISNTWLERQMSARTVAPEQVERPQPTTTLVVAASPLRFGMELSAKNLTEIPWGTDVTPSGSFQKIDQMLAQGRRMVLNSMEPNEPVLSFKITGPGERATLSALMGEGERAVTIRVDDVFGVAGFVLPGDRVDVILTRSSDERENTSDILVQGVKVLAIDQLADERTDKPLVAKAVTLAVDAVQAQKIALGTTLGTMSLTLRAAGDTTPAATRRIGILDLMQAPPVTAGEPRGLATVTVTRAAERKDYSVPAER